MSMLRHHSRCRNHASDLRRVASGVMRTSSGALREGVIYDLGPAQPRRRARTNRSGHAAVFRRWQIPIRSVFMPNNLVSKPEGLDLTEDDIDLLSWSGRLHEIGIAISQKHYNRHSAYL